MKSKIIIILMFILAVCLLAPVSASDNATPDTDDITVSFNDTVYKEDLGYIDVEIPENTSGNLKATINDVEFYNENVSQSQLIPISIPQKAVPVIVSNRDSDHTHYAINVFFNNFLLNSSHSLKVMNRPSNYTVSNFPSEFLKDDPEGYLSLYFPESANGEIKVYIDGEFSFNTTASHYTFINATRFNSLTLANHNATVVYSGDRYYQKFNKTFNFTVVDMTISIPSNVVLDHDDCISTKILNNRDGTVTIYVDNQRVFKDKLDDHGELIHSLFDDVTCGEHLIEVQYNASNFTTSKKAVVNVSYLVDIFAMGTFYYGAENEIIVIVPTDFNRSLCTIDIDGVDFDFEIDDSGWIELDLCRLNAGNHTLNFNFKGDEKYNSYSESKNFTITYAITVPAMFLDDKNIVSLKLPGDANGNLLVYVEDSLYKSKKLINGVAEININSLAPGKYNLIAKYDGVDYNVSDAENTITVSPDITTPGVMYCGEDKSIVLTVIKSAKGKVIFAFNGKNQTVDIKNGKAILNLKNFSKGLYDDINATYIGDDGFNITVFSGVEILPSKIKLDNVKITTTSCKMKVYINGKLAKNTNVSFKIDKKSKKVKTDKNGIATIKLNPGKHTITASFKDAKVSKTVQIHAFTLNTVKIKKSTKKVVLSAKLTKKAKNKVIKFKFNGKTIKAKTNKKGIAKVTFKTSKLKAGKKITYSATYLKDTVKKTVTVKK